MAEALHAITQARRGWLLRGVLAVWAASFLLLAAAQDLQPVPALTGHVVDGTGTLTAPQQQALEAKLQAFETARGTQLVVLLVATTQPEDIASYANRVANAWKIGRKDIGDGLLVLVAKNDRKLRIEVAKTLEGAVPDLAAKRIIDEAITPRLRQGDFAGGLDAGVDQLIARVKGEALPAPAVQPEGNPTMEGWQWVEDSGGWLVGLLFVLPIAARTLRAVAGRPLGAVLTGAGVAGVAAWIGAALWLAGIAGLVAFLFALLSSLTPVVTGGRTRGRAGPWIAGGAGGWSSGSSGGSSGGFSSGGGGDFGGGGASGDW